MRCSIFCPGTPTDAARPPASITSTSARCVSKPRSMSGPCSSTILVSLAAPWRRWAASGRIRLAGVFQCPHETQMRRAPPGSPTPSRFTIGSLVTGWAVFCCAGSPPQYPFGPFLELQIFPRKCCRRHPRYIPPEQVPGFVNNHLRYDEPPRRTGPVC